MFKDQYERDNAQLRLDDEATARILSAIQQEKTAPITYYAAPERRRKVWPRVVALVACFAVVVAGGFGALRLLVPDRGQLPQNGGVSLPIATPAAATSYGDVFKVVDALQSAAKKEALRGQIDDLLDFNIGFAKGDAEADSAAPNKIVNHGEYFSYTTTTDEEDATHTNTQYANVDEADVVKTDGTHLYILNADKRRVTIVKADGENTAKLARIDIAPADGKAQVLNMYYCDDRLVVLYQDSMQYSSGAMRGYDCIALSYTCVTRASVYDVSDRANPRHLSTLGQDGALVDSRMVDGVLYLVTNHSILQKADEEKPQTFVPSLYVDDTCEPVAEEGLCISAEPDKTDYALVTASAITGEVRRLSEKAVFGSGSGIVYANTEHLMVATPHTKSTTKEEKQADGRIEEIYEHRTSTALNLFSIKDGQVTFLADTVIEGLLDGQFAIDEYNGYFRIAATRSYSKRQRIIEQRARGDSDTVSSYFTNQDDNALYVLNGALEEVGRIDEMAEDEQVKSVRFSGNIGYVVTFRQTDPLFAIDLSDPTAPRVLSALKITGFSEYLHPYGDGRLLGFGYAGTESGINGRLKLTMFNTEDNCDVTVHSSLDLPATIYHSEALHDHHAILVDSDRAMIGFPAHTENGSRYILYTYSESNGFTPVKTFKWNTAVFSAQTRGIFIGERFYLCYENGVLVYDALFDDLAAIDF